MPARRVLHHNSKTVLQKKATEKWYRAVRIKNLTKGSDGCSACTAPASVQVSLSLTPIVTLKRIQTDALPTYGAKGAISARRCMKNKTPLTKSGAFCRVQNTEKTVFVRAWKQAAELLLERVLPRPAWQGSLRRP